MGAIIILDEMSPIRIEMFFQWIKRICQNNIVLLCSEPSLYGDLIHASKTHFPPRWEYPLNGTHLLGKCFHLKCVKVT